MNREGLSEEVQEIFRQADEEAIPILDEALQPVMDRLDKKMLALYPAWKKSDLKVTFSPKVLRE